MPAGTLGLATTCSPVPGTEWVLHTERLSDSLLHWAIDKLPEAGSGLACKSRLLIRLHASQGQGLFCSYSSIFPPDQVHTGGGWGWGDPVAVLVRGRLLEAGRGGGLHLQQTSSPAPDLPAPSDSSFNLTKAFL